MGFYLRKSVSVGPFRFNLSGSGVGVSVGIPGFRVGSGPRGNYVHLGRGGIYYRHTFTPDAPMPARPESPTFQEIESGSASMIVDATSEELIEEIRRKRRKLTLKPFAIAAFTLLFLYAMGSQWPSPALTTLAILGVVAICAGAARRCTRR